MKLKINYRLLFFVVTILLASCTNNYEEGLKQYKEKNYDNALGYLKKIENSDENYYNAQVKIAEIDSILSEMKIEKARQDSIAIAEKEEIIEVRICPRDGINIRTGPGTNYKNDESGQLVKGEKLYVLEEKNGWIRFRVTPKDVGWSGWVKKNLTVLESQKVSSNEEDDIKTLKESGLLIKINPQLNESYVNPAIWRGLDYQTKENIGRIMAFYCGRKKGTNLNWVDIKDSYSGKKLAKYSESWGFKVY